jgi:hypothetical protein
VIQRRDGKYIPVPISYGPRDKWLEAQKQFEKDEEMFEKMLPRMSYEIVAMNYDQTRKITNKQTVVGHHETGKKIYQRVAAPVPYNLDFTLYIQTKNLNDGWAIIEQILPFFTPSYTVKVRHFPHDFDSDTPIMQNEYDMPFTLLATAWADDWTGDIESRRTIEWNLEFQTKIFLSAPVVGNSKVIFDSRGIISIPSDDQMVDTMNRGSNQAGIETGWAALDSEVPTFDCDSTLSPNVINIIDSDTGNTDK